jgi:hypothetical protein
VSLHYEVVFSLFLRDDLPADVLNELRWHLGLSSERPTRPVIDYEGPQLRPAATSYLPGGETASLQRQYRHSANGTDHYAWGLHVRLFWLDDQWAEVWWQVAAWLAAWADEDGYAGFFREEAEATPTLLVVRGGEPELREGDQ